MAKFDPSQIRDEADTTEDLTLQRPATEFTPSPFQERIFKFASVDHAGSAVIDAVAGSGKTTTALRMLSFFPQTTSVVMLAFNKTIADTLTDAIKLLPTGTPFDVKAMTFHSAGNGALWAHFKPRTLTLTDRKLGELIKRHFTSFEHTVYGTFVKELVKLAKGEGVGTPLLPDTPEVWKKIYEHHDLELEDPGAKIEKAISLSRALLEWSTIAAQDTGVIDYDDQLYLVTKWNLPMQQRDVVIVDEAQDTNPLRRDMIRRLLRPGGRVFAIGDPYQSIYGFTGASVDSMDLIKSEFSCVTLPLSVNYRCALKPLEQAQKIVPHIQPRPDAPEGEFGTISIEDLPVKFGKTDAILCRNNAPLIPLAYDLISRGIGATVLGRNIGQGLVDLIRQMHAGNLEDLVDRVKRHRASEVARYTRLEQDQKANMIADKCDCVLAIVAHLDPATQRSIIDLYDAVEHLFADENKNVLTLGTVHKAKGKEWDKVAILRPDLMPARWAKLPWQQQQELNLMYVAYTRAKFGLYLVSGGNLKGEKKSGSPTTEPGT